MATLTTNPLLPVLAIAVVSTAGIGAYVVSREEEGVRRVEAGGRVSVEPPREADADSTSDTITALSGMVDELNQTVTRVTSRNEELVAEKAQVEDQAAAELEAIKAGISEQMTRVGDTSREVMATMSEQFESMQAQIRSLEEDIARREAPVPRPEPDPSPVRSGFSPLSELLGNGEVDAGADSEVELVPGLGLEALGSGRVAAATDLIDFVWIDPLDRPSSSDPAPEGADRGELFTAALGDRRDNVPSAEHMPGVTRDTARSRSVDTAAAATSSTGNVTATTDTVPWFTLPDLSVMTGAVSLTALVGRIYLDETIQDPWPFKTLIGRDNLTANYHDLPPEIDGMLYEGYGVGDWTLGCVRGWVTVASFVFDDGTVLPAYANSPGARDEQHRLNRDAIGYLSDPHGNPCVLGERITNAPAYLGSRLLAAAATGYAEALNADNRVVSSSINADGSVSSVERVLQASGTYAAREAYADAFREGARWIRERQAQSFDAVFVPPGAPVVVNLQAELRLDKRPDARRLSYRTERGVRHHALD